MPAGLDLIFLVVTGGVAMHALTWRDKKGRSDWVRLLFGCIALVFFLRVLLIDIIGLV
mgnify:CR=1 FL=1|jgi:hypothetical protein